MIPNEYLYYYYFNAEALEAMQAGRVRSSFLAKQQAAFYAGHGSPAEALRDWKRTHAARESTLHGGGLDRARGGHGRDRRGARVGRLRAARARPRRRAPR